MDDSLDILSTRSFYFEIRDGNLIEVPIIEYIHNYNQYVKELIKRKADPFSQYEDLKITMIENGVQEVIFLDDASFQQTIIIATQLEIPEEILSYHPDSISLSATTGDCYVFSYNIFEQNDYGIYLQFCNLVIEAFDVKNDEVVHLFLPDTLKSNLSNAILEIVVDANYGSNMAVIDVNHPRRQEIEQIYQ